MSSFLALPDDLVAVILALASEADNGAASLARLATVCTRFRSVVQARLAPRLRALSVTSRSGALRWAVLHRCTLLETLSVEGNANAAELQSLLRSCCTTLRVLRLERLRHLDDPQLAGQFSALEELHLAGCRRLTDTTLVSLTLASSPPPLLHLLDLSNTAVSDTGLQLLARCPLLASVNLEYALEADGAAYTLSGAHSERAREAAGVTHIGLHGWLSTCAQPSSLRRLSLSCRKAVRQGEMQVTLSRYARCLTHLDLSHMNLEGVELLRWLWEDCSFAGTLQHLNLAALALGGTMTLAGAAQLSAACPALRYLDISNWRISPADETLVALGSLPLTDLTLVRCAGKMTVVGLQRMLVRCPTMERLTCVRCVPDRALAYLAAAYPGVTVCGEIVSYRS